MRMQKMKTWANRLYLWLLSSLSNFWITIVTTVNYFLLGYHHYVVGQSWNFLYTLLYYFYYLITLWIGQSWKFFILIIYYIIYTIWLLNGSVRAEIYFLIVEKKWLEIIVYFVLIAVCATNKKASACTYWI